MTRAESTGSEKAFVFPTSFSQEVLFLVDRAAQGQSLYNIPRTRRIRGPIDVATLEHGLARLTDRHEIIRTRFAEQDEAVVQLVAPQAVVPLEVVDLRGLATGLREPEAARLAKEAGARPFDLTRDLMLRATLYRLADDDAVLLLTTHHIASDGWSGSILFRDLLEFYLARVQDREPSLPPLPIQFGDFAAWQRENMAGERLAALQTYWAQQLAGPLSPLELPTDRPRTSGVGDAGASVMRPVPTELAERIRSVGRAGGASTYMVLLAGIQATLARLCGTDDVIIGSPVAGRDNPDVEALMGFFANTVPLRAKVGDDPTFAEHLGRVRKTCLDGFDHQDMPIDRLLEELKRADAWRDPSLFRVVFTMLDDTPSAVEYPGLALDSFKLSHDSTKFDLTFFMSERGGGLRVSLVYRTDLFEPTTAARILDAVVALLDHATAAPGTAVSRLSLVSAGDRTRLDEWQGQPNPATPALLTTLIAGRAQARPEATAIRSGEATLTYGALWNRSTAIAERLAALRVGAGDRVGLCLDRDLDLMAAVIGIWRAGAAYVPLLPDLPPARLAQLVAESGAGVVVTSGAYAGRLPASASALDIATVATAGTGAALPATSADSLAYVLFTSGSTGTPKGVAVSHGNLAHYVRSVAARIGLALDGSTPWSGASVSTLAADLGHTAVFPTLAAGGTLHLVPTAVTVEPARWAAYTDAHRFDLLKITPSHLRALIADQAGAGVAALLPARWLILGGEACPWALVRTVTESTAGCRVLNHYGPTETTVGVCTFAPDEVEFGDVVTGSVPIGRPLANMHAEIRDRNGELTPIGFAGELWLGGPQVATGYLAKPDLTAERFVERDGLRWYRTGDRVRRLGTGDIEFLGRLDAQVKVRGHRVEPEEIEAFLATIPGVRQAAVALAGDQLIGYVVADPGTPDAELQRAATAALPDHMVPSRWIRLDRLPINANGKLDRRALPAADVAAPTSVPAGAQSPRNETERTLVGIWQDVLKRPSIGIEENFFDMGGHSLTAIRVLGRVAKAFGARLPLKALFEAPTIAAFAEHLAPKTPLEEQMIGIWKDVLKKDRIGLHDNFFDQGGHSLLAIRLLGRISKVFGVRLALRDLFEAPTVGQLSEVVDLSRQLAAVEGLAGPGPDR